MKIDTRTKEQVIEDTKKRHGMSIIEPQINSYALAISANGYPCIFAKSIIDNGRTYWIITDNTRGNYMFKDSGVIGYTNDTNDMLRNSFGSSSDAIKAFYEFYKTPKN
jgi:hypothetical protein